ncbi:roundabout homolog 3 [Apteryx mantelli]|uniref:Roundabout homolog 3 n=1 Tax=Apteryx mantelli TaxID=2696672 RepID=A0ABM4FMF2_9AVES
MLRYLLKTLLQMNLFADSLAAEASNSSELLLGLNGTFAALDLRNLSAPDGSGPHPEDAPPRIVEHPADLLVSRGEAATLRCRAEGRPTPAVRWYRDGERVPTAGEEPRSHRTLLPGGSLFFARVLHGRRGKADEGVYVCVATNYLGEATSRNASLEVAVLRDDFRQAPGDVAVTAGEPAVLECVPPRGHPEPSVSWKKNGVRLSDEDRRLAIRGGKLMVASARKSDAGAYVCVAANAAGERDSEPAELVVLERPVFSKRPLGRAVLAEATAEFACEARGDPLPAVHWRKDDGELPPGRWEVREDNALRISRVTAADEGTYTCVAENSAGRAEASAALSVHVPPQLVTGPRDQTVARGQTATFRCETRGNPPPAVFWQKEGSQILLFPSQPPQPAGRFSVAPSGEMTVADVQAADAGYYVCQAISVAGSVLAKALLEVEDATAERLPPVIRRGPSNQTLPAAATARLPCRAAGNPLPTVRWLKDGQALVGAEPRATLLENGTLQITGLRVSDSGQYVCVAASSAGETRWSGALRVQEGRSGARCPAGADAASPVPGVLPAPPSAPRVTGVTESTVALAWDGGRQSGAAAATSYVVEAFSQSSGGAWRTVAADVKAPAHTVSGLEPGAVYLFLVRAANAFGLSDPSAVSEPVRTRRPPGASPELARVAVRLQEPLVLPPGAVRLTWTVDGPAALLRGYRVLYRRRGTGSAWEARDVAGAGQRGALLTELRPGQEYEIKVRPVPEGPRGAESAVRAVRTPEAAPSAPPRAVRVAPLGDGIAISWEPPPAGEQNGVIQDYRIWCLGNESRFDLNASVEGTALAAVLRGLVPGVPYRAQVAAATGAGVGVRSPPVPVRIAPAAERDVVPAGRGAGSSLAERVAAVAKRPAFIAGLGGATWLILMGSGVWIYLRRKRKKELSHFTAYMPAGAGKAVGKAVQPPALSWPELLPPPPSASELSQYEEEEEDEELASSSGLEDWCPPLPERGYATGDAAGDTTEEGSPPATPSPAGSCGRQSTATLTPSPRAERRAADRIPRLRDFDSRRLPRRPPNGASTLPRALSPGTGTEDGAESPAPRARRDPGRDGGCSPGLGERRGCATASISAALVPKSRPKPKSGRYRRDQQPADLPPPPLPPPLAEDPGVPCPGAAAAASLERRPAPDPDDVVPYGKPTFLTSSRGSTGSRGHGSGRSRTPGDRGEVTGRGEMR